MSKQRKKSSLEVPNIVVVSDLHCGCQLGLFPAHKSARLRYGGDYTPSGVQRKVWSMWEEFWNEWVPMACHGEPYCVVVNGDALDGVHHGSKTQVTHNLAVQSRIAQDALLPFVQRAAGGLYMVAGTEAHVGQDAEQEEQLAQALGAIPDATGQRVRNDLWLQLGPHRIHFLHHVGTCGSAAYESTGIHREFTEELQEAARWGRQPPSVIVRSHRHRHIEVKIRTNLGYGIAFVTPAWQLKTPFAFRVAGARLSQPQIGGSVIRYGDHDIYTRHKVWDIAPAQPEAPALRGDDI